MLRKDILERVRRLKEWADWPAVVLLAALALAAGGIKVWNRYRQVSGNGSATLDLIEHILLGLDVLGAALFLFIQLFPKALRPNRDVVKIIRNKELSDRLEALLKNSVAGQPKRKVNFCSTQSLEEVCQLDFEAFRGTVYGVEIEELRRRYLGWYNQNDRIFALVVDTLDDGRNIGYSIMVPLTAEGVSGYLAADFKDRNTPPQLVARDRSETTGVLLFAIALRKEYSFTKSQADRRYSIYFEDCVCDHALALFPEGPEHKLPYRPFTQKPNIQRSKGVCRENSVSPTQSGGQQTTSKYSS
jgi:hypothetical protein